MANSMVVKKDRANIIGRGNFGVVYHGTYGGKPAAIKVINTHRLPERRRDKVICSEIIVLVKELKHPNVIEFFTYQASQPPDQHEIYIAMELCQDSLDNYLDKITFLSDAHLKDILHQCAQGIHFLHEKRLAHRDVKPNNFLIKLSDSDVRVKVTDFSLSGDIEGLAIDCSTNTSVHGNPHWMAPELLLQSDDPGILDVRVEAFRHRGYDLFKLDIFALGLVMMYVGGNKTIRKDLFSKVNLGKEVKAGRNVLDHFNGQWMRDGLFHRLQPLLSRMLSLDPQRRPFMDNVVSHFRPVLSKKMPRLTPSNAHSIGFGADCPGGVSSIDECVLLVDRYTMSLLLYQLTAEGFSLLWEKPWADGVQWNDVKLLSGHGKDLLFSIRNWRGNVICYDGDLCKRHEHKVSMWADLIGVLPAAKHRMVYRECTGKIYQVHVYDGDTWLLSLRSPSSTRWGRWLSVCQEERCGWIAVSDWQSSSLCMYNEAGELQQCVSLDYRPNSWNAITSTQFHVLVSQFARPVVHIHAWSRQWLGSVDLLDKFALGWARVQAVSFCDGGRTLIVAVGYGSVTTLHALRVELIK